MKGLGRDVGVNVVANLIAGAIAYLVAVAFGYLKGNPALTIILVLLLISSSLGTLTMWSIVRVTSRRMVEREQVVREQLARQHKPRQREPEMGTEKTR